MDGRRKPDTLTRCSWSLSCASLQLSLHCPCALLALRPTAVARLLFSTRRPSTPPMTRSLRTDHNSPHVLRLVLFSLLRRCCLCICMHCRRQPARDGPSALASARSQERGHCEGGRLGAAEEGRLRRGRYAQEAGGGGCQKGSSCSRSSESKSWRTNSQSQNCHVRRTASRSPPSALSLPVQLYHRVLQPPAFVTGTTLLSPHFFLFSSAPAPSHSASSLLVTSHTSATDLKSSRKTSEEPEEE
jgi:hypothetical protein